MKLNFIPLFLVMFLCSCTHDLTEEYQIYTTQHSSLTQTEAEKQFSTILSKAIFADPDIRSFLKREALLKKDNDHNVFYALTKDKQVSQNKTLYSALKSYAENSEDLDAIEAAAPLLNIFIPDLTVFSDTLSVEMLDITDGEIPVFNQGKFYVKGIVVDSVSTSPNQGLPLFHTFVVNQSHRMKIVNQGTRAANGSLIYDFADDAYNPQNNNYNSTTRARSFYPIYEKENLDEIYDYKNNFIDIKDFPSETLQAFKKVGNGNGVLRTMLTYNLDKIEDVNERERKYDDGVRDVIFRLKIDPALYYMISNHKNQTPNTTFLSPYIKPEHYKEGGNHLTIEEALQQLWSDGNFTFKINVVTGKESQLIQLAIKPQDLFAVTITGKYKHRTFFRKAKYWYYLDPHSLEPKWIYPHKSYGKDLRFSAWNPFKDALNRNIYVYVAGSETAITREISHTNTYIKKNKTDLSSTLKLPLKFIGGEYSIGFDSSWEHQNTEQVTEKTILQTVDKDILTGNNRYSFFGASPISHVEGNKVYLNTYRYGCFDMCIIPVKKQLR